MQLSNQSHRKTFKKIITKNPANLLQIVNINISAILKAIPFFAVPSYLLTKPFHRPSFCLKTFTNNFLYFYPSISSHKKARDTVCCDYTSLFTCSRLYQNLFLQISANSSRPIEREPSLLILGEILGRFRTSENKS